MMRYDATEIMSGVTEVICYGSAVDVEPAPMSPAVLVGFALFLIGAGAVSGAALAAAWSPETFLKLILTDGVVLAIRSSSAASCCASGARPSGCATARTSIEAGSELQLRQARQRRLLRDAGRVRHVPGDILLGVKLGRRHAVDRNRRRSCRETPHPRRCSSTAPSDAVPVTMTRLIPLASSNSRRFVPMNLFGPGFDHGLAGLAARPRARCRRAFRSPPRL